MELGLCSIYAPDIEGAGFSHNKNKIIGGIIDGHTIVAGDFNQVLSGVLGTTTISKNMPKDRLAIKIMTKDLGLIDVWRLVNPREKEHAFFLIITNHTPKLIIFWLVKHL